MTEKRLLIVEDDDSMARLLQDNLASEGFSVERSATIRDARERLKRSSPDVVLLDLTFPEGDGLDVCRALASQRDRPPIIIISARSSKDDRVVGLNLGADDYLTKPFAFDELLARVRAVMRRRDSPLKTIRLGNVSLDFRARRAFKAGRDLGLSHREFEVLHYLAERIGRTVTREDLLLEVWGYRHAPLTRSVDILIARLRRKIELDAHRPRYIRTLHGDGYSLSLDD